ncbi:nucleoside triphosphate pyrophosphohydrolase [Alteromonas sp. 38]|uniref:nucleoside triphosphate pyrophosphohydrolase n=1 Tax=unclassified Alteromonas TaxID=2614992 RepID=UPI0012F1D591|nr:MULTISPECIES: nucleoside triphosphate pyrophosphohydrolase [unclassified Alteromonas]CAD5290705.1 nucleoside triphosphate pyrophosphohydrolase [Alteromonas sp. 154]VXB23841.1 nucleoside triphosphate pyrophosphohydrolase [Alteromonas sp. 38]
MQNANNSELPEVKRLQEIMAKLRDPKSGCPWDVQQTMDSLTRYTIEEAYEVADAIAKGEPSDIRDELGDLLFQVVFYSRIAEEEGNFTFNDVAKSISDKMTRRHPHVFGNTSAQPSSEEGLTAQWDSIKAKEKALKQQALKQNLNTTLTPKDNKPACPSLLDDVPVGMPALMYAQKLQKACAKVGFDWPEAEPVLDKVREEVEEIQQELDAETVNQQALEEEIGDALFAMVNVARHCKVDADTALRNASNKFAKRFRAVEFLAYKAESAHKIACEDLSIKDGEPVSEGSPLENMTLDEMEALWQQAKITTANS